MVSWFIYSCLVGIKLFAQPLVVVVHGCILLGRTKLTKRINSSGHKRLGTGLPGDLQTRVQEHCVHGFGLLESSHGSFVDARHERVGSGQATFYHRTDRERLVITAVAASHRLFGKHHASRVADENQRSCGRDHDVNTEGRHRDAKKSIAGRYRGKDAEDIPNESNKD